MCGIAGIVNLSGQPVPELRHRLGVMNRLQAHRGPDGEGIWTHASERIGFGHRRLSIIDLDSGRQPMADAGRNCITYNGEIYNYIELRDELGRDAFRTSSDTEVILHAYRRWGQDCLRHLRGMFAFALWDEARGAVFCARDRFGIKPFYYAVVDGVFYCASEAKALLPFLKRIEPDPEALSDYLTFQFYLDGKTLFRGIQELPPGHQLTIRNGAVEVSRYWEVYYELDWDHTEKYFHERTAELLRDSVRMHLRADVPVGAYLSGGLDSSLVAGLAAQTSPEGFGAYIGKFTERPGFDESPYARLLAEEHGFPLKEIDITADDFIAHLRRVIYHLDEPIAGPGSFPQYMVSGLARQGHKVVLGGQGGDEIFGGYTRYLIAYFEQCIKGAIDGTINSGNFVVTYESIIPNLVALAPYKPLLRQFWKDGLFESLDLRYFRLVSRAPGLGEEIRRDLLGDYSPRDSFRRLFNSSNVKKESYFDLMTHFDFKTLLPALLHVEDRMSMAHSLESRVPFLDHPLIEFAATMPANIKFHNGTLKHLLRNVARQVLPPAITDRKDKMGFPVPINGWITGAASEFVRDIFGCSRALSRDFVDNRIVLRKLDKESEFGRTIWGLLSLEVWHQEFVDRQAEFQQMLRVDTTRGALPKAA